MTQIYDSKYSTIQVFGNRCQVLHGFKLYDITDEIKTVHLTGYNEKTRSFGSMFISSVFGMIFLGLAGALLGAKYLSGKGDRHFFIIELYSGEEIKVQTSSMTMVKFLIERCVD